MAGIDYFKNVRETVNFNRGDRIFDCEDCGDKMYVIREGIIHITFEGKLLETLETGDWFGEMSLIDSAPRSAEAVAATDCVLSPVDRERFLFLVHETPTFAIQVMQTLADRLRHMNEMMVTT